jgi:3-oxoadipate enol-lactonase
MSATVQSETGHLAVEGGKIYYEVAGTGHPLVLVHAGVADHRMWDDQFAAFAERFRVVRYDARGFGKTEAEHVTFSDRQDIADLLRHLGIEKTYMLGLSRGGMLALDFTLEHPELVDALIVAAGGVGGYETPLTEIEQQGIAEWIGLEQAGDYAGLTDLAVRVWADGLGQPEGRAPASVRERLHEMVANNYRLHPDEMISRPLDPPAFGRLAEIRVPTLAIVGDIDTSSTIAAMNLLADQVAGARLVVFPGVAHMVNMEQPERFNAVVLEFLQNVGGPTLAPDHPANPPHSDE